MLSSITTDGLTLWALAACSALSIVLGLIVAFTHTRTASYTRNFAITLVVLPILVQAVMMMVNGNLGTAVAILGAFSLVRFRSIPGTSREIVAVFFAMAVGLATGTGYIGFAILLTIALSAVLLILHAVHAFDSTRSKQTLKITIPENVDHHDAFDEVFEKYVLTPELKTIKTKNMGSLYELEYGVEMPRTIDRKKFMDDLRVRNGNLAITIFESQLEGGL